MLRTGRLRVRFLMRSFDFSIDLILPAVLWSWGSTQPPREMTTRNLPGGKGWPAHKANNLTATCEPICLEECGSLDVSHPCGSPWLVTGIALSFSPTTAEVRNTWIYASTPLYVFMA
jgi:hypothetical protein